MKKYRIYVDMDKVLCNYDKRFEELYNSLIPLPQTTYGFYTSLEPIEGAIEGFKWLSEHFDVWILTRPSYQNPLCYTEKRVWVEKYFGLEVTKKLIICWDKSLFIGDLLIDDTPCDGFQGEQILFGFDKFKNWNDVRNYIRDNHIPQIITDNNKHNDFCLKYPELIRTFYKIKENYNKEINTYQISGELTKTEMQTYLNKELIPVIDLGRLRFAIDYYKSDKEIFKKYKDLVSDFNTKND